MFAGRELDTSKPLGSESGLQTGAMVHAIPNATLEKFYFIVVKPGEGQPLQIFRDPLPAELLSDLRSSMFPTHCNGVELDAIPESWTKFVYPPPENRASLIITLSETSGYVFCLGVMHGDDVRFSSVYPNFTLADVISRLHPGANPAESFSLGGKILPTSVYSRTLTELGVEEGTILGMRDGKPEREKENRRILTRVFFQDMEKSSGGFVFSRRCKLCRMLNFCGGEQALDVSQMRIVIVSHDSLLAQEWHQTQNAYLGAITGNSVSWTQLPKMLVPRCGSPLVLVSGSVVYAIGGTGRSSCEKLGLGKAAAWKWAPALPTELSTANMHRVVDERYIVIWGRGSTGNG